MSIDRVVLSTSRFDAVNDQEPNLGKDELGAPVAETAPTVVDGGPFFQRTDWLSFGITAGLALAVYLLTLAPEVTLAASKVSRLPEVRQRLIALQRSVPVGRGMVMEGRDIGTVVFPEAPLKIFLRADPEERARRRLGQEREEGQTRSLEQTAREIDRRDRLDSERKISPLVAAPDACQIDSTRLTADQVVERIVAWAREKKLI